MPVTQEITETVGAPAYDPRTDATASLRDYPVDAVAAAIRARARATANGAGDAWATMLHERNRLVDQVNGLMSGPNGEANEPEALRLGAIIDDLEAQIDRAPACDRQAVAARMRLTVRRSEEGFDMTDALIEQAGVAAALIDASAPGSIAPTGRLAALEAELKAAEDEWAVDCGRTDEVKAQREGREISEDDRKVYDAASARHMAAIDALLRYRPRDVVELARKAELLNVRDDTRFQAQESLAETYLADALVLARGASLTSFDLAERVHEDLVAHLAETGPDDELPETYWDALNAVWSAPAPNVAAVAKKLRLHLRSIVADRLTDDIDDPRHFSAMMAESDANGREPMIIYQDLLRLAGLRPEIAQAKPYDPTDFIRDCDAAGISLKVCETNDDARAVITFLDPKAERRTDLEAIAENLIEREVAVIDAFLKRPAIDPALWFRNLQAAGGSARLDQATETPEVWIDGPVEVLESGLLACLRSPRVKAEIQAYLKGVL